jgi:hypothetical protein
MIRRRRHAALALCAVMGSACDEAPRVQARADASSAVPEAAPPPPTREGCTRTGGLELIETDPACVVQQGNDEATRAAVSHAAITLEVEPPEVLIGGRALVSLKVRNVGAAESTFFFEARLHTAGPRPDWSKVANLPAPHTNGPEVPRLFFAMTTSDSLDHDVDALPMVPGSGGPSPVARYIAVHLKPGATLTRQLSWLALRIPAPPPPYKDDAGHIWPQKTTPTSLSPGVYRITVELPLYGPDRDKTRVSTNVRVVRPPVDDPRRDAG